MSSVPGGISIVLGVDRSRVDAVLAELRQGISVPTRFDVVGQPSAPAAGTPPTTFGQIVAGQPAPPASAAPLAASLRQQPIPIQLDFTQARQQVQQLGAELRQAMASAVASTVPSRAAGQPTPPPTSSASRAEELYRAQEAAIPLATRYAVERARQTGAVPSARQLRRRFADLGDEGAADVRDEARAQVREGRQRERQQYRQDTADFRQFVAQERAAAKAAKAAQPEPEDEGEGQSRPPRRGGLFGGGFDRYLSVGYLTREALRTVQASQDYQNALSLATGPLDRVRAEQQLAQHIGSLPIVGQVASTFLNQKQLGVDLTLADAQRQDQRTAIGYQQQGSEIALRNAIESGGARGVERQTIENRQRIESLNRDARDRAAVRSESIGQQNEADRSALGVPRNPGFADIVADQFSFAGAAASGQDATEADIRAQERIEGIRAKLNAARERKDQAYADELQGVLDREAAEAPIRAASGYEIQRRRAVAGARQYSYEALRDVAREETRREASEILEQQGAGPAAAFLRLRGAEERARDVERARRLAVTRVGLYGEARSALLNAANDPFGAQLNGIVTQGQVALGNNGERSLIAPIIANNAAQLVNAFAGQFRQFSSAQAITAFQTRAVEAGIARNPLEARLLGIRAERFGALDEADKLPAPLQQPRREAIDKLYAEREQYERQQFQQQTNFARFGIRAEIEQLDLTVNGPGSPALRGSIGQARGIVRQTQQAEAEALAAGQGSLVPDIQKRGTLQLEGFRAEFLRSLQPTEVDLRRTDLSGPGAADPSTLLSEISKGIAEIAKAVGAGGAANPGQQILQILRKLVPDA